MSLKYRRFGSTGFSSQRWHIRKYIEQCSLQEIRSNSKPAWISSNEVFKAMEKNCGEMRTHFHFGHELTEPY